MVVEVESVSLCSSFFSLPHPSLSMSVSSSDSFRSTTKPVHRVPKVSKVQREWTGLKEHKVPQVHTVRRVHEGSRELQANKDVKVRPVLTAKMESMVHPDLKELRAQKVHKVQQGHKEKPVRKVHAEKLDLKGWWDRLDLSVKLALWDHLELMERTVQLALLVLRVLQVKRDWSVRLDLVDLLVRKEMRVPKV